MYLPSKTETNRNPNKEANVSLPDQSDRLRIFNKRNENDFDFRASSCTVTVLQLACWL